MTPGRRAGLLALVPALALALAGCGSSGGGGHEGHDESDTPPAFAPEEATTTVEVTLRDFTFAGLPASLEGPNVLFEAQVTGGNTHELEVSGPAGVVGSIVPFTAGKPRSLAVVLEPGTYTVQCLVKEGSRTHAQLGMTAELTVTG